MRTTYLAKENPMRMIMVWLFYCLLAVILGGTLGYRHGDQPPASLERDINAQTHTSPGSRS